MVSVSLPLSVSISNNYHSLTTINSQTFDYFSSLPFTSLHLLDSPITNRKKKPKPKPIFLLRHFNFAAPCNRTLPRILSYKVWLIDRLRIIDFIFYFLFLNFFWKFLIDFRFDREKFVFTVVVQLVGF